ncbi:MAG: hypothetical protein Q9169_007698 [Polycauliona sp. 2 TL-2023]
MNVAANDQDHRAKEVLIEAFRHEDRQRKRADTMFNQVELGQQLIRETDGRSVRKDAVRTMLNQMKNELDGQTSPFTMSRHHHSQAHSMKNICALSNTPVHTLLFQLITDQNVALDPITLTKILTEHEDHAQAFHKA